MFNHAADTASALSTPISARLLRSHCEARPLCSQAMTPYNALKHGSGADLASLTTLYICGAETFQSPIPSAQS